MYKLFDGGIKDKNSKKSYVSTHHFKVPPGNGIFRMFYDTHNSGVRANVRILDDASSVLFDTRQQDLDLNIHSNAFHLLLEEPDEPNAAPFTIEIEYHFIEWGNPESKPPCPFIEILVMIQPFDMIQNVLACPNVKEESER